MLRRAARGATLIELMIAVAIAGLTLMLGLPAFTGMLQNFQIRTAAESVISGLQTARSESVRRNVNVRFQFVDTLDDQCNLVATGPNWLVSRNDPNSACDQAEVTAFVDPNVVAEPQILQKRSAREGTPNVVIAATSGGAAATSVIFTNLGRVATGSVDTINFTNPAGGNCEHDITPGDMRCLRIQIGTGGQVRMCDPKVTLATDSRFCQ